MIKSTTDYSMFKMREDNRVKICKRHIEKLKTSIKMRNLLQFTPITVNKDMEVMDGQHRLVSAQELGVPIYYKIVEDLTGHDIIRLNVSKSWASMDYLHYYVKNDYCEYKKLQEFMKKSDLPIKVALTLTMSNTEKSYAAFREGNYKFIDENLVTVLEICRGTIDYLRRMNGSHSYLSSAKFWRCLVKLVQHSEFNLKRWEKNISKFTHKFCSKATSADYDRLLMEVHNYRNQNKIDISDSRVEEDARKLD